MKKKNLILSLIKDDLINSKMVYGLNRMGLNADTYLLHLGDTIFELMGFENNEEADAIFERYVELTQKTAFVDISESHEPMEELAMEIYRELLGKRR